MKSILIIFIVANLFKAFPCADAFVAPTPPPATLSPLFHNKKSSLLSTNLSIKKPNSALSSTISHQTLDDAFATHANHNVDNLWHRLEKVSMDIRASSKSGSTMVSQAAIEKKDPEILPMLKIYAGLQYENVPKTWPGLIKGYLTKGGGGFITLSILATCVYRLAVLVPSTPFGVKDLVAIVGTRLFWEAQEWLIHSRWFHGDGNFRAQSLFKSHDRHHDLPYNHVAVEPLRLVLVWWATVANLILLSVNVLGASLPIMATVFATYQASGFVYSFTHAAAHSMIPFKENSYWKRAKVNHVKHHISPGSHLNLGPNRIDKLMGTVDYATRLKKSGHH